ncbi:class I SAM-dependent methyltransferase [Brevundimonas sp. VNH65]|uniref:class I SAM-dependent methyltransferase n=1 Tax=Brevundimonas sp. VNH65 TaxID=3400917 RepID=UPI003C0D959F
MSINRYFDEALNVARIQEGGHRGVVGGMWDAIGPLQRDFLIAQGLAPHHAMIDIGCGALRGGVPLTAYLDPGNYYGVDISAALIEAGYVNEITPAGLADRLPRHHLRVTDDFDVAFGRRFDFALAVSLFTHLTLDYLTRCLDRLGSEMDAGGRFYFSVFEGEASQARLEHPHGIVSHPDRDPFHFSQGALAGAAPDGWRFDWIGDWGHPRNQQMARFTRV